MKINYLFVIFLLSAIKAFSQPGTLDISFGNKGKVLSTSSTGLPFPAYSVISKNDGGILAGSGEAKTFIVKQFLNDGTPDSSFGDAGEARTAFNNYLYANINALSIIENNKIVAAGSAVGAAGKHNGDILLARYLENGNADSSFGDNGKVMSDFDLIEVVTCMKITNEKKILVGGYGADDEESKFNFLLVQYNADGTVDKNFGDIGKVITDIGEPYNSEMNSIAIATDGSIIATGKAEFIPDVLKTKLVLAKYTNSGKLDESFGDKGLVFTDVGDNEEYGNAVVFENDNKIVVAGVSNVGLFLTQAAMLVVRYNTDGSVDKSFNNSGFRPIYIGKEDAESRALIIQSDGKILLGGLFCTTQTCDFALVSITQDGRVDSSFGTGGIVTTDFLGLQDECYSLTIQQDGKIIAGGGSSDNINNLTYLTLARYNNDISKKQIIITKIKRWLQHHNGFTWDANSNIRSYIVQRSYDGIHFNSLTKISAGNQSNLTYKDPTPLSGNNYYRLQTTSTNGAVNYSNVIAVANSDIKISPNPAKNVLQIQGLPSNQKIKLSVVDFSGNTAISQQLKANSSSYNLNIASLKAGNYLLKVEMNDDMVTKKFVKE